MLPPETRTPRIAPMLATSGDLDDVGDQTDWSFEMKWDGVRAVASLADGEIGLAGRSGRDITAAYPELLGLGGQLDVPAVLDGEIVAFDSSGRPSFADLQPRIHVRDARQAAVLAPEHPVVYLVFDLLHLEETSLLSMPYATRRETLESLEIHGAAWQVPPAFVGLGTDALRVSGDRGLEGVVAKRLDSGYEPGRRSANWIKVKHVRTHEVVVGGWRPGEGSRAATIGSLLCGIPDAPAAAGMDVEGDRGGRLRYVGRVGTGFSQAFLHRLQRRLGELAQPENPFGSTIPVADARDAHWVRPELVGEVAFSQWTPDGRLWHPRWRGLRDDKSPEDVGRES